MAAIDDSNPKNDKAQVFAEGARPVYEASRVAVVMSSYAPGGTEIGKCGSGEQVLVSEVRTAKNRSKRGRICGNLEGWVTIQLPNGSALFKRLPRAQEEHARSQLQTPRSSGTGMGPEHVGTTPAESAAAPVISVPTAAASAVDNQQASSPEPLQPSAPTTGQAAATKGQAVVGFTHEEQKGTVLPPPLPEPELRRDPEPESLPARARASGHESEPEPELGPALPSEPAAKSATAATTRLVTEDQKRALSPPPLPEPKRDSVLDLMGASARAPAPTPPSEPVPEPNDRADSKDSSLGAITIDASNPRGNDESRRVRLLSPPELTPPADTPRGRASTEAAASHKQKYTEEESPATLCNTRTAPAASPSRAEKMAELRKNLMRVRDDANPVRSRKQRPPANGDPGGSGRSKGSGDGSNRAAGQQASAAEVGARAEYKDARPIGEHSVPANDNSGLPAGSKLRDVIDKQGMFIGSPRAKLQVQPELAAQGDRPHSDTTTRQASKLLVSDDAGSPDTRPGPAKSKSKSSLLSASSAERRKRMISFAPAADSGTPGRVKLASFASYADEHSDSGDDEEDKDAQRRTGRGDSEQDSQSERSESVSPTARLAVEAFMGTRLRPKSATQSSVRALLNRSSWRERAQMQLEAGRQKALESRTKVQRIQPELPLDELVHTSTVKDTLYFTFFGFDKYKHWDDFANLKEGLSKYIPGKLGLADLSLYCIAACCVLLSMFDVLPSWISCTAIFALPHYISDACTLEMITLKLVMATFEWKLLAAHNVLYVASAADGCILLPHRFCLGLSDLFRDFRVVGVWIGFFPGFLLVSCMDAVTFTAVKTRRTMTLFLIVVIVPLLVTVFVGIAKGAIQICPREIVCSRSLKTCVVTELTADSACGGAHSSGSSNENVSAFGTEYVQESGDTYTLISNLGLTTTALTTLIMFQLKYAFYWYKYRERTMLLTVYMERRMADADHAISLRGRSRQPSMWSDSNGRSSLRSSVDSNSGGSMFRLSITGVKHEGGDTEHGADDIENNLSRRGQSPRPPPSFTTATERSSYGGNGSVGADCPMSSSSSAATMPGGQHELQRLRSQSSLRVLDVCTHTCAQQVRNSLRESFSVPSSGDAEFMEEFLDMAAEAAAVATADALEIELKDEESRLGNLLEESESDLAEWPRTPDSLRNSAGRREDGDKGEEEEASLGDDEKASLMSPPVLCRDVAVPSSSQAASAGPASAASLAAALR